MTSYYIDTCIYLNLWQKEESKSGIKYWQITQKFLEYLEEKNHIIYYSGFILKELSFILTKKEFKNKKELFANTPNFTKVLLDHEELEEARKIEKEVNFEVSFYDIIHMILARKTKSVLITRDKRLRNIAVKYKINVKLPEEIVKN